MLNLKSISRLKSETKVYLLYVDSKQFFNGPHFSKVKTLNHVFWENTMEARAASNFIIIVTLSNIQQNTPRKCKDKSKFQNTTFWLVAIQKWIDFYFPSFEDFIGKAWVQDVELCKLNPSLVTS